MHISSVEIRAEVVSRRQEPRQRRRGFPCRVRQLRAQFYPQRWVSLLTYLLTYLLVLRRKSTQEQKIDSCEARTDMAPGRAPQRGRGHAAVERLSEETIMVPPRKQSVLSHLAQPKKPTRRKLSTRLTRVFKCLPAGDPGRRTGDLIGRGRVPSGKP